MDWESYRDIVMDELNVKAFHVELDETKYTSYQLKLNFKTAGPNSVKCECSEWLAKTIITRRSTKLCINRKKFTKQHQKGEVVVTAEDVLG